MHGGRERGQPAGGARAELSQTLRPRRRSVEHVRVSRIAREHSARGRRRVGSTKRELGMRVPDENRTNCVSGYDDSSRSRGRQ